MDTSKEYMEMCKKAEEIQSLWVLTIGDFVIHRNKSLETNDFFIATRIIPNYFQDYIWLPRQDQLVKLYCNTPSTFLQELIEEIYDEKCVVAGDYHVDYLDVNAGIKPAYQFETIEQVYLNFLMTKRFDLMWDKEQKDWVRY